MQKECRTGWLRDLAKELFTSWSHGVQSWCAGQQWVKVVWNLWNELFLFQFPPNGCQYPKGPHHNGHPWALQGDWQEGLNRKQGWVPLPTLEVILPWLRHFSEAVWCNLRYKLLLLVAFSGQVANCVLQKCHSDIFQEHYIQSRQEIQHITEGSMVFQRKTFPVGADSLTM